MTPVAFAALLVSLQAAGADAPPADAARAEALFNQAMGASSPTQMVPLLVEAIRLRSSDARFWIVLGDACAERTLQPGVDPETLELAPGDEIPQIQWGAGMAHGIYEQGAKAAPDSPLPLYRLADLHFKDDPAKAAGYLERAMALDPKNAYPVYLRALLHFQAGEDDQGCRRLEEARERKEWRYPLVLPTEPLERLSAVACCARLASQFFPQLAHSREFARQIARVAEGLPAPPAGQPDRGVELLLEGQRLGHRLLHSEPTLLITALVGVAVDAICTKSLEKRLANRTDTGSVILLARMAERRKRTDAFRERTKEIIKGVNDVLAQERIWVFRDEGEKVRQALKEAAIPETAGVMRNE